MDQHHLLLLPCRRLLHHWRSSNHRYDELPAYLSNSLGECYDVPLVLLALSIFPKTEFGAFYATMYLMMDISGVIAGFLAGPLASLSYSLMYYVLGGITLAGLISIIFAVKKYSAIANSSNKNSEQEG